MTVKELKDELSKFDDNLPIKYVSDYKSVKDLYVYFEEGEIWVGRDKDRLIKILMMYGDY